MEITEINEMVPYSMKIKRAHQIRSHAKIYIILLL